MAVNEYLRGRLVRLTGNVTNEAGVAVNPSGMVLKVKDPDGVVTTYTYGVDGVVTRPSTGLFQADIVATEEGRYSYRWESATPTGADEGDFRVRGGEFD